MFPQESGFNRHIYSGLESEMAAWANAGAHIDMRVDLVVTRHGGFQPTRLLHVDGTVVQQVPDRVAVQVDVLGC